MPKILLIAVSFVFLNSFAFANEEQKVIKQSSCELTIPFDSLDYLSESGLKKLEDKGFQISLDKDETWVRGSKKSDEMYFDFRISVQPIAKSCFVTVEIKSDRTGDIIKYASVRANSLCENRTTEKRLITKAIEKLNLKCELK